MHANHFHRLALAQGLLPFQPRSAPAPDGKAMPGVANAEETLRATPAAEQTPTTLH